MTAKARFDDRYDMARDRDDLHAMGLLNSAWDGAAARLRQVQDELVATVALAALGEN